MLIIVAIGAAAGLAIGSVPSPPGSGCMGLWFPVAVWAAAALAWAVVVREVGHWLNQTEQLRVSIFQEATLLGTDPDTHIDAWLAHHRAAGPGPQRQT